MTKGKEINKEPREINSPKAKERTIINKEIGN